MTGGRVVTRHEADEPPAHQGRPGSSSRGAPVRFDALVVLVAATVSGAAVRVWQIRGRSRLAWKDSADFLASSAAPWPSLELWAGRRTPAAPVLLMLVGGDGDAYVVCQAAIAVACWAALAVSLFTVVEGRRTRWLAVLAVLGFSLTAPVTMWERSVLSESLAISLLALVVATGLQLARGVTAPRVAVALAALAAWLATRDSHAVVALLGGIVLVAVTSLSWWQASRRGRGASPATVRAPDRAAAGDDIVSGGVVASQEVVPLDVPASPGVRSVHEGAPSPSVVASHEAAPSPGVVASHEVVAPPAWLRPLAVLGVGAVVLGVAVGAAAAHGERHAFPMRNVYEVRVLPYPERVRWFAHHGMPQADEFLGPGASEPHVVPGGPPVVYVAEEDAALAPWRAWVESDGRAVYAEYVAAHPAYLVSEPLRSPERAFNNAFGDRQFYAPADMRRVPLVDRVLALPTAVVLVLAGIAGGWALGRGRWSPALGVGVVTAALALPHGLFAWHSDGMETARHLVVPALQFHLGALLMLAGALSGTPVSATAHVRTASTDLHCEDGAGEAT